MFSHLISRHESGEQYRHQHHERLQNYFGEFVRHNWVTSRFMCIFKRGTIRSADTVPGMVGKRQSFAHHRYREINDWSGFDNSPRDFVGARQESNRRNE